MDYPADDNVRILRMGAPARPTRLLLVTSDDPIYVIEFFRVFFAELPERAFDLKAIAIDHPFRESKIASFRRIAGMYGLAGAARQVLRYARARLRRETISELAAARGIEVFAVTSVNDPAFIAHVQRMDLDVIASGAAPEIFGPELLGVPPMGCINIHSGRLPRYRGMMPTFWQKQQGEPEVTITVHRMVEKLDAGDVLGTRSFPLRKRDTLDRVIRGTKREGARLLIEVLTELREGRSRATPLDMRQASYFTFPAYADVRALRRRGHRLL